MLWGCFTDWLADLKFAARTYVHRREMTWRKMDKGYYADPDSWKRRLDNSFACVPVVIFVVVIIFAMARSLWEIF